MQSLTAAVARASISRPTTARCFSSIHDSCSHHLSRQRPRPTAPVAQAPCEALALAWHQLGRQAAKSHSRAPRPSDPGTRAVSPRPPAGPSSFTEPGRAGPRSPLLVIAGKTSSNHQILPPSHGLMGHDMGLDASSAHVLRGRVPHAAREDSPSTGDASAALDRKNCEGPEQGGFRAKGVKILRCYG